MTSETPTNLWIRTSSLILLLSLLILSLSSLFSFALSSQASEQASARGSWQGAVAKGGAAGEGLWPARQLARRAIR